MASRLVAVLGTPCGATNFIATSFEATRLDVRHEHVGQHGTVCGFMAWGMQANGRRRFNDFEWEHIVRLIRHPLSVAETLPSYAAEGSLPNPHVWKHPDCWTLSALRFWVATHERITEHKPDHTLRVGPELDADWVRMMDLLGIDHRQHPQGIKTSKPKSRRVPRPTVSWWEERDPEWALRGMQLWAEYGA